MFKKLRHRIARKLQLNLKVLTIQETFNKVIDLGYYRDTSTSGCVGGWWMCNALQSTYNDKHITTGELHAALNEISLYLKGEILLSRLLKQKNLPSDFYARLLIYKNWDNRP